MLKAYDYLYFGLYRLFLKSRNYNDIAGYVAVVSLSCCLAMDIFILALPLRHIAYPHVSVKAIAITMCFTIGLINYLYFLRSDRYLRLIEEYKATSYKKLESMDGVAIAFCVLSFASPILLGIIKYLLS